MKKINWMKFIRVTKPNHSGEAIIDRRKIYIVPTKYGFIFGAILIIMLTGSINYANNLGFMLTFILGGMGLATMIQTWRNLLALKIKASSVEPVFKGQKAFYYFLFESPKRARLGLQVNNKEDQILFDLQKDEEKKVQLHQITNKRGWLNAQQLRIYSFYPLGLLKAWCYADLKHTCLVYPTPSEMASGIVQADNHLKKGKKKGQGNHDFSGHQYYRAGDPVKHIDWKATARQENVYLKIFEGENATHVWLDWDAFSSTTSIENRLSFLTKAVLESEQSQIIYGLKLPNQTIELNHGERHKQQCLMALALYE